MMTEQNLLLSIYGFLCLDVVAVMTNVASQNIEILACLFVLRSDQCQFWDDNNDEAEEHLVRCSYYNF